MNVSPETFSAQLQELQTRNGMDDNELLDALCGIVVALCEQLNTDAVEEIQWAIATVKQIERDQAMNHPYAPNEKVAEAIRTIMHELNGGNRKQISDTIYETVTDDHRTLQQMFWSAMLLAQIRYADDAHDGRNEQSVQLAQAVKQVARNLNFDHGLRLV